MKAVVLAGVGDVRVEEVADPQLLEPTDAIVRVNAAAICGADLFPLHGMTPGFENGTVMGHEFAGVVVETGSEVSGVKVGDRVVNTSMVADGSCPACRAGRSTQCSGARCSATRASTHASTAGRLSSSACRTPTACSRRSRMPFRTKPRSSSPTTCRRVRRGRHARRGARGDLVAVVGLGAVGLMAVMCAVEPAHACSRSTAWRLGARPPSGSARSRSCPRSPRVRSLGQARASAPTSSSRRRDRRVRSTLRCGSRAAAARSRSSARTSSRTSRSTTI